MLNKVAPRDWVKLNGVAPRRLIKKTMVNFSFFHHRIYNLHFAVETLPFVWEKSWALWKFFLKTEPDNLETITTLV